MLLKQHRPVLRRRARRRGVRPVRGSRLDRPYFVCVGGGCEGYGCLISPAGSVRGEPWWGVCLPSCRARLENLEWAGHPAMGLRVEWSVPELVLQWTRGGNNGGGGRGNFHSRYSSGSFRLI